MGGSHSAATNDIITASDWNSYVRDNTIPQVTSATRPTGVQGQIIYETDTSKLQIYSGSGWVEFGGHNAWTSYTPTLTQSSAVTKTVTYAKYLKVGRMVTCIVSLASTGAGVANNAVTITLPFTATSANLIVGGGFINDASASTNYPGILYLASTTTAGLIDSTAGTSNVYLGQTGAAFSAAIASGDSVNMYMTYESTS